MFGCDYSLSTFVMHVQLIWLNSEMNRHLIDYDAERLLFSELIKSKVHFRSENVYGKIALQIDVPDAQMASPNMRPVVPPTTTTTTTPAPAIQTDQIPRSSSPPVHLSPIMLIGEPCSGVLISDTKVLLAIPANDIAIVTLDAPVIFSKTVGPVCLPPASTDPDQYSDLDAVALGWGTAELGYPSATLQQATVGMLPKYLCREEDYFGKYISELNICVKSNDEENLQCCDLGGPVVVQTSPGIWTVIGINSFARDCGGGGLKTRVSAFRTWIDRNI
ncbi:hypothetical protein DAPPUDRAFT_246537 [Daphnia pulex]|uniref:Peptidase S1 domain-containing protein n=1 Tax=Daphnia pulex TaxID=6669 RepID=E9GQS7_DAPPU|nr:hypothetical protein DAPPUDRAFT_246537 [Daphnia pulex]|eukprot:EFX78168.1 hypothetical protein DAPPUDRAFT_246537 [Daphnia pulex]